MNSERTHAYRRVLQTLRELGPSKLQAAEQDRIREAADSLIFCADLGADESAQQALAEIRLMLDALVDSGRWERVTADRLADEIRSCGPVEELALNAA